MMNSRSPNTLSAIDKKEWQNLDNLTIRRVTTEAVALSTGLCKLDIRDVLHSVANHLGW